MPFSIYQASIPVLVRGLNNLAAILHKAQSDAEARKIDAAVLIAARLAPDMHPLSRQVQIASDTAKNAAGRLSGTDLPSDPDTETTFEALYARLAKTVVYIESISESAMEGADARDIRLKFPGREMRFTGADYLTGFVLPNFYFHLTAAYAILRHNGVPLGKMDFVGVQ